jgi:endoglucanase
MGNGFRYRSPRLAGLTVLVITACGSESGTTLPDGSVGETASASESGAPQSRDGGLRSDTGTSDATSGDVAVDAYSPTEAAKPSGDAAAQSSGDAAQASGDAAQSSGDAGATDAGAVVQGAGTFHGLNWADARDNFVNGLLQLSGLDTSSDTYSTVQAKASQILAQFGTQVGANAIRIPINEPTVSSTWWTAYKAVIDTATAAGMKVIIAYWAYHNGKPDDETAFQSMWQTVVSDYGTNGLVYFDIHNEPYGFGASWNDEAAMWLGYFPSVPKGRVIVAGTGYDDNVTAIGGDSRFAGCLLQLHIYGFQHTSWTTRQQWTDALNSAIGSYAARTIVGEWGDTMNTGINYDVDASDGNNQLSYVTTLADYLRSAGMGSCYWPGLRDGDGYSMTSLNTSGSTLTLSIVNMSGLDRLHWAWNL